MRECLGNFLGHPVVGEYHTLSNGLVNAQVLFWLDAVHNTLGLELKLNFRSRLQPGRERESKIRQVKCETMLLPAALRHGHGIGWIVVVVVLLGRLACFAIFIIF